MKISFKFGRITLSLLLVSFTFFGCSELNSKNKKKSDPNEFKIVVEKNRDQIRMKSFQSTAWVELSFSLNNNQIQAIDEYGKVELDKISLRKDQNLADFLFTIRKTNIGYEFKGIEGTSWNILHLSLSEGLKQVIDQNGITSL